jgi:hypothetical protein
VADSIESNSSACERLSVGALSRVGCGCPATWREHNDNRAELDAIVEVDDVLVGHADAARGDGAADIFRLVGAVNTVLRVLAGGVQI